MVVSISRSLHHPLHTIILEANLYLSIAKQFRSALILDSLDAKKGSVKGLCMAEAKRGKFGKEGEASRFLKVIVEVLKCKSLTIRIV